MIAVLLKVKVSHLAEIWEKVVLVIGESPENNDLQICLRNYFEVMGGIFLKKSFVVSESKETSLEDAYINSICWFFETIQLFLKIDILDLNAFKSYIGINPEKESHLLEYLKERTNNLDLCEFQSYLQENKESRNMILEIQTLFMGFKFF